MKESEQKKSSGAQLIYKFADAKASLLCELAKQATVRSIGHNS